MTNEDHKPAAIVFTDIVGYTRQMEENEQRTMQLLQRQREIIFPMVGSYGGEVIKEAALYYKKKRQPGKGG